MSAIPNIPHDAVPADAESTNADAAMRHLINSKVDQANGTTSTNGSATETQWQLHETPIENQHPIKVIVIGAGYSGIYAGIRIPERLRNCELVIYEKNAGVGGTWFENQYPGAACDVPSHSYQFSFDPKPDWSSLYAPSWEIRDYLQNISRKYGADRFIKLQHRVVDAVWNQEEGKWHVKVEKPDGSNFEDIGDVIVSARGNLNNKQWPDVPGLWDFQGKVMHSAAWDQEYDFRNKRIGVVGSGSSAIQIIPKLQKIEGATLNCFIRNRTWISPPLGQGIQDRYGLDEFEFTPDTIRKFKEDPLAWEEFRKNVEFDGNNIHAVTIRGTEMQKGAQQWFEAGMKERLKKKPEYFEWLKPGFSPGCRRLSTLR